MTSRPLTEIDSIGFTTTLRLYEQGYRSTDDLRDASASDLAAIDGIGIGKLIALLGSEGDR